MPVWAGAEQSGGEAASSAQRGNNGSDFPKGSDTGTEINCTILKMNKGICAVIKEA